MTLRRSNNRRRGQTLIIAIMVMFILGVVATVFIAIVARNLFGAGRFSSMDAVQQIAEAGVRYADQMLTTSEDGADWRPVPDNLGSMPIDPLAPPGAPPVPDTSSTYEPGTPNWLYLRDNHPDFKWTRAYSATELFPASYTAGKDEMGYAGPTGGYTTSNTGRGRYLLRISYNPNPNDPLSKFIRIESVGRWGEIERDPSFPNDPTRFDPTTLKRGENSQLRREVTAFKPIGVTEYLRFVTNKANRSAPIPLGVPGFALNYGRSDSGKFGEPGVRGGPIRVNGNLLWYGDYAGPNTNPSVDIYLRGGYDQSGARAAIEKLEVAGDIQMDTDPADSSGAVRVGVHAILRDSSGNITTEDTFLQPSDDPSFSTFNGFCRDGSDQTDPDHFARGVKRIEPPLVDQPDPTNTTTRYRVLTLNSGDRIRGGRRSYNSGAYGWGRGIYISNSRDRQSESETLIGGYTVRADWLKPNSGLSAYWRGPYYVPPGAVIVLHPNDTDGDGQDDLTITRTDVVNPAGQKTVWTDAGGHPRPDWGQTVTMPYPDQVNGRDVITDLDGQTKHIDGNGVIFAEGNIRIRGMLPKGMQLTIASNQNIYIEGSLLKYRDPNVAVSDTDPYRGADSSCGLALLARENICVNTTQFFAPQSSISADDIASDAGNGQPPLHVIVSDSPDSQLRCAFEFGPWESESVQPPSAWMLMLRHAGQYGPSYINCWLNPSDAWPNYGILMLNGVYNQLPPHVWGVGDPNFSAPGWGIGSAFAGDTFDLAGAINDHLYTAPGVPNLIQLALDQTTYTRNHYLMGGMAIVPMDVRIEAVLYAQEGSFFVLPGNWFNPDPQDDGRSGKPHPPGVDARFPFFGEALDIRITVDGAITENLPAAVSDVSEWMAKWGMIPRYYGSTNIPTAHPGEGVTLLYDDHVGWPLKDLSNPNVPIRMDKYGRPLPIAPKLPVSPTLLYLGDVM